MLKKLSILFIFSILTGCGLSSCHKENAYGGANFGMTSDEVSQQVHLELRETESGEFAYCNGIFQIWKDKDFETTLETKKVTGHTLFNHIPKVYFNFLKGKLICSSLEFKVQPSEMEEFLSNIKSEMKNKYTFVREETTSTVGKSLYFKSDKVELTIIIWDQLDSYGYQTLYLQKVDQEIIDFYHKRQEEISKKSI